MVPPIAVGRDENENEPNRPTLSGRLGSFWFSTGFTRKTLDYSNGTYLYPRVEQIHFSHLAQGRMSHSKSPSLYQFATINDADIL